MGDFSTRDFLKLQRVLKIFRLPTTNERAT